MDLNTFFENFDTIAEAPGGIQKLRSLILDLAIRGKLVPQKKQEEDASILLEKIKNIRGKINHKKKRRSNKIIELIPPPDDWILPYGWRWTNLQELGEINPRNVLADKMLVGFVPMNYVPTDYRQSVKFEKREWSLVKKGFTHFANGDVGLAKITPCFQNGKAVVFNNLPGNYGAGTTELLIFRPFQNTIIIRYILVFLKSSFFVQNGIKKMTGTAGQKRLPRSYFAGFSLPIPPVEEQKRIVAKVDELMGICDKIEAAQQKRDSLRQKLRASALDTLMTATTDDQLKKAWEFVCDHWEEISQHPNDVSDLRHAIIQIAVRGKLVDQSNLEEPAQELIDKIRVKKKELLTEKKIPKPKKLEPLLEEEMPYSCPTSWAWTKLGKVTKRVEYGTSSKASITIDDIPIFRMNNIKNGELIFEKFKYVSSSIKDLPKLFLYDGDLLFNRTNSYELVGKTGVFRGEEEAYTFASYLIRVSLMTDYVVPEYLNLAMNSAYFRQTQIEPEITQQCGQANFNGTKLQNTLIPLPPLGEQYRIITKFRELMSLCDYLEENLRKTQDFSEEFAASASCQLDL